jgi:hypothetical protein
MKVIVGPLPDGTLPALRDFTSFRLQSPLPDSTTARFENGRVLAQGKAEWTVTAEPGVFLFERKTAGFGWVPILLATNDAGTVVFSDPLRLTGATFYRARRYE